MIKLLQWNIWNNEDIDNIVKELKRIDADIVCIQELAIKDDNDIKIRKLKEVYPHIYYEKADTFLDGYSQCNAILSKYPLYDKNYTYVQKPTDNKNDYSKEGRVYIEAKVKINDEEIQILEQEKVLLNKKLEEEKTYYRKLYEDKANFVITEDMFKMLSSDYTKEIEEMNKRGFSRSK